ncbi:MAG: hypothetical protein IJX37_01910 [Oscillospiraceae bacterium]|nr:hypothetical protein [Oscillospiraceae bacterium]
MAKKYEFKPDKPVSGIFSKLFLTQKQRRSVLRWGLYSLVLLALSVLQDVLLCRFRLFGATTELVPCGIFLICLLEGLEKGSVFSLCASCLYLFSGSAPGNYAVIFITALSVAITAFRQSLLRKGFRAAMLCTAAAILAYELLVFAFGLFLGMTTFGRIGSRCVTALLTFLWAPVLYPILNAISTIGGEAWKE